jgi:hypothetical protein
MKTLIPTQPPQGLPELALIHKIGKHPNLVMTNLCLEAMSETLMEVLKRFTAETIATEMEKATKHNNKFGQSKQNIAPNSQSNSQGQTRPPRPNNNTKPNFDQRTCWTCGIVGHISQFCEAYH